MNPPFTEAVQLGIPAGSVPAAAAPQPVLQFLRELDVSLFTIGGVSFSVSSALKLVLLIALLFWFAALLRRLTEQRVLRRTPLDTGTREAVGALVRYLVLVIGFALILQNVGINLTALSVVAGAVGVGVGFGLQNIVSNFISGLIIMFERPIRIGDRIEVAGIEGTVREIGARRTTVFTDDNVAILVPNQRFIIDNVVNHFYAHAPIRLRVPLQLPSTADTELVRQLLTEAAHAQPDVLGTPPPQVLLTALGGATMSFELTVWHDARGPVRSQLSSDLAFLIDQRLRSHGLRST